MTRYSADHTFMIIDACVLIDFIKSDRSVLELIVKHVGIINIISPIIDEVHEIQDERELLELGLTIIEPDIQDAYTAASVASGATSFQDRLCLLTAKRHGLTCITNDTNLRKLCKKEGIPLLWGLEIIAKLHKAGGITAKEAERIANQIQKSSPKHITDAIISRFRKIIRRQDN